MSVLRCLTWTTRLEKILARLQPGDLVKFHRGLFVHHAVYVGRGRAVHHHLGPCDGEVIEATMEYLAKGDLMKVVSYADIDTNFTPADIIRRARSQIGPLPYSLHGGNCEHFTSWVYHGVRQSAQLSGLCQYELRLLRVVRHSKAPTPDSKEASVTALEDPQQDCISNDNCQTVEEEEEEEEDRFVFVPPRPVKYRRAKNSAGLACNHAKSCLKVLVVQATVGLAAVPLYRCGLQADNLQRLGRRLSRRHKADKKKSKEEADCGQGSS